MPYLVSVNDIISKYHKETFYQAISHAIEVSECSYLFESKHKAVSILIDDGREVVAFRTIR